MNNDTTQDREHLKILSICYYVFAGLCTFPFLYGFIYMFMGVFVGTLIANDPNAKNGPPPVLFGGLFVAVGLVISGISLAIAIAAIKSGRNISRLSGRTFAFVFACIICMFVPLGTILGVFTLIVLSRECVKSLFDGGFSASREFGGTPPDWK